MDRGVRAPHLTPTKLWEWPTILSLDAPLIAVLWQALFAQVFGVSPAWYHLVLLAAPVWLVYSADRLFDGWQRGPGDAPTRRHHFYTVHRREVVWVWLGVLAGSLLTAALTLRVDELMGGLLVLGATLGYFARLHLLPASSFAVPKEVQVALLFGAGVALFILPDLSRTLPWAVSFTSALALFTSLCALNCGFISYWEREGEAERRTSLLRYPNLRRWLQRAALGLAWSSLLSTLIFPDTLPLCGSVAGSALVLFELERMKLGAAALRVLGDAALLTPAPVLLILWLLQS